mmetsp:Transcript_103125/g.277227  ORF Transcript_103125/g.277227 Transcript_103125/m.277227 type:complete len:269 (-) Transcript_103125:52-858(-)
MQKTTSDSLGNAPGSNESAVQHRTALLAKPPPRHWRATAFAHSSAWPVSEEYKIVTVLPASPRPAARSPPSASADGSAGMVFFATSVSRFSRSRNAWISLRTRSAPATKALAPAASLRGSYVNGVHFASPRTAAGEASSTTTGPSVKEDASRRTAAAPAPLSAAAAKTPPYSMARSTSICDTGPLSATTTTPSWLLPSASAACTSRRLASPHGSTAQDFPLAVPPSQCLSASHRLVATCEPLSVSLRRPTALLIAILRSRLRASSWAV